VAAALKEAGLPESAARKAVESMRAGKKVDSKTAESTFEALEKCVKLI